MSILLDALRKSEQRERLGDVPDIHGAPLAAERSAGRPWRAAVIAVAVVLLAAATGWLGWRAWSGPAVPVASPEFAPESAADPGPAGLATGPMAVPDAARPVDEASAGPRAANDTGVTAAAPTSPRLERQPRSPVEVLAGEQPPRSAERTSARPVTVPGAETAAATATRDAGDEAPAAKDAGDTSGSAFARDEVLEALTRAVETTGMEEVADTEPAAPPARPARAPAAADENEAGLISYWQLPQNVRDGLPELRITVLAWDENPGARFLIMGGRRFGEGDEVSGNLVLEEIRRDRVLFRHRAYLFYVKQ